MDYLWSLVTSEEFRHAFRNQWKSVQRRRLCMVMFWACGSAQILVIKTAKAAKDVLIEKESFKILSKYLHDIEPVLKQLQLHELKDSQSARRALEFLSEDVSTAQSLIDKCTNRSRFYLLLKCRQIVKEAQQATRDIGRSLASLSLSGTEILADMSEKVNQLHHEMQKAEFKSSNSQLKIIDKLNQGILEHKTDQGFANDLVEEIARAVGVPIEPSEISREIASFKQEREEAALRKESEEVFFLQQVISLLSRADAAKDEEEIEACYIRRVRTVEKYGGKGDFIPPFNSFICPLKKDVMIDPVSLCTGTTCERAYIKAWLDGGNDTDPETGQHLDDFSLRPNVRMRESIEEWVERNYCLKIRSAKSELLLGSDVTTVAALNELKEFINDNSINKYWIGIEGLVDIIVSILGNSHNKDVKRAVLVTLLVIVKGHAKNKDKVVDSGGLDYIVRCLIRDSITSKAAVELLFELLLDGSGWNVALLKKLSKKKSCVICLVNLLNGAVVESSEKAEAILLKLCEEDDDNIKHVAAANWYKPLINCLHQGPESSRISMAGALSKMELVNQNLKLLGEGGAIPLLLDMLANGIESKSAALGALAKLSACHENRKLIAQAGGVPLILDLLFTPIVPTIIIEKCSEILANLSSANGTRFLVDSEESPLYLEEIVTNLVSIQQKPTLCEAIRKYILLALLGICRSEPERTETLVSGSEGLSVILPLLEHSNPETREASVKLLSCFSHLETDTVTAFLSSSKRVEAFVSFFEDEKNPELQAAAAQILSLLPNSDISLTESLIGSGALPHLIRMLRFGSSEAKEKALGAIIRFTEPSMVDMQRMVVEMGVYPLLVESLHSGSSLSKTRSAATMANLSRSTPNLSIAPEGSGFFCFGLNRSRTILCKVHGGVCDSLTTFCLLKADALPALVKVLREKAGSAAKEAVVALATLVCEDDICYGAAWALHEAGAIDPLLDILLWGTSDTKEEVVGLLEKVFTVREVVDSYGLDAKLSLVKLSMQEHENVHVRSKAMKVLSQLEHY
ncbi:hypothetical protein AMTRI_Chr03g147910 [Amborella trichopoda]